MLGAIIGDTVGSIYEFDNIKTTDFPFFSERSEFTDDSVMSVAVADWLLRDKSHTHKELEASMVRFANQYPDPKGGYGWSFYQWLFSGRERKPYNSWGNGSAMRVSAVGWAFGTLEETLRVAEISAAITHNHPEGIKGAQAVAAAIFLGRTGKTKAEIKEYVETHFGYDLSRTCEEIRPDYAFEESCQGTVPEAIIAFLDSTDFESAVRLAVSLGGDSDTLACITGGIAEAYYQEIPEEIVKEMWSRLPECFQQIMNEMKSKFGYPLPVRGQTE
ncbi:MAG: ADP-ribosylglycohydrolase family protein [Bacteroidales bacterium]|nr:ADP-ribosylglycohydrolase family protein [Bacteroidales bacterium]